MWNQGGFGETRNPAIYACWDDDTKLINNSAKGTTRKVQHSINNQMKGKESSDFKENWKKSVERITITFERSSIVERFGERENRGLWEMIGEAGTDTGNLAFIGASDG